MYTRQNQSSKHQVSTKTAVQENFKLLKFFLVIQTDMIVQENVLSF